MDESQCCMVGIRPRSWDETRSVCTSSERLSYNTKRHPNRHAQGSKQYFFHWDSRFEIQSVHCICTVKKHDLSYAMKFHLCCPQNAIKKYIHPKSVLSLLFVKLSEFASSSHSSWIELYPLIFGILGHRLWSQCFIGGSFMGSSCRPTIVWVLCEVISDCFKVAVILHETMMFPNPFGVLVYNQTMHVYYCKWPVDTGMSWTVERLFLESIFIARYHQG